MAEALTLHLAGLQEDGETVPEPSGIEASHVSVRLPEAASMAYEREAAAV